jgi:hypothetical protein
MKAEADVKVCLLTIVKELKIKKCHTTMSQGLVLQGVGFRTIVKFLPSNGVLLEEITIQQSVNTDL